MPSRYTKEELQIAVRDSFSIAEVCRKVGLKPAGGKYSTLKKRFHEWNICTDHFRGQGWNVGLKFVPRKAKPLEDILKKGSHYQAYKLKRRLLQAGIKEAVCEECDLATWNNQPIPLELHHVNGDRHNNRIENIQLLCPNCHAQTHNYRGKNIRVAR